MSQSTFAPSTPEAVAHLDASLIKGFGEGLNGRLLFLIAVVFSSFQVFTAIYGILPSQVVRAFHVGFLLLLLFPLFATLSRSRVRLAIGWVLGLAAFAVAIYQYVFYGDLLLRAGAPTEIDLLVGSISLILLFLGTLTAMGPALPIISGVFLAYCFLGQYLPPPFVHRGYDFEQVIEHMAFGTEGIYGIPTLVSSTRSEERRVGKECRSWWSRGAQKDERISED